jgi:hypothetical protein
VLVKSGKSRVSGSHPGICRERVTASNKRRSTSFFSSAMVWCFKKTYFLSVTKNDGRTFPTRGGTAVKTRVLLSCASGRLQRMWSHATHSDITVLNMLYTYVKFYSSTFTNSTNHRSINARTFFSLPGSELRSSSCHELFSYLFKWGTRWCSWQRHCAIIRKIAGSTGIFTDIIIPALLGPRGRLSL